ncbi:MAG: PHP-associated domain-containing protein [archaeon]|nr:PHP-associated domain-containing protein [archaeon]
MLKAELHTHINEDPKDNKFIRYSGKELVDKAILKKFDVLAITCHNLVYQNPELKDYAKNRGLILIYGIERDVEEKHVLMYNITQDEAEKINSFQDLALIRKQKPEILTIAAHPVYWGPSCLRKNIIKHLNLFDAWEYSFFHTKIINPNKKLLTLAKKHNKPVVGNSDVHVIHDLGRTYSLIDSEKDEQAVLSAIKEGKVRYVTNPLNHREFFHIAWKAVISTARHQVKKRWKKEG